MKIRALRYDSITKCTTDPDARSTWINCTEVVWTSMSVSQLTESASQSKTLMLIVADDAIVGDVSQVNVKAASIALWNVIRNQTVCKQQQRDHCHMMRQEVDRVGLRIWYCSRRQNPN